MAGTYRNELGKIGEQNCGYGEGTGPGQYDTFRCATLGRCQTSAGSGPTRGTLMTLIPQSDQGPSSDHESWSPNPCGAAETVDYKPEMSPNLAMGKRFPRRYQLIGKLGDGSMGEVYLAEDLRLHRHVALKIPKGAMIEKRRLRRFRSEARAAARLGHENICKIFDYGSFHGTLYLAMDFINGRTLLEVAKEEGQIALPKAVEIVRSLARALQYAHEHKVIHRDLKPANIMIETGTGRVVITDFGLAKLLDVKESHDTREGELLGTPLYMAPEQGVGRVEAIGPTADVYSLGVILYELLTAKLPFGGSSGREVIVAKRAFDPVQPSFHRREIDSRLDEICQKAIAREPTDRYSSMAEFAINLEGWLKQNISEEPSSLAVPGPPVAPVAETPVTGATAVGPRVVGWWPVAVSLVLLIVVISGSWWFRMPAIWSIGATGQDGQFGTLKATWAKGSDPFSSLVQIERVGDPKPLSIPFVQLGGTSNQNQDGMSDTRSTSWIGRRPTTEREFELVTGRPMKERHAPEEPITDVSWNDATEYCGLLQDLFQGQGLRVVARLPTEKEWGAKPPDEQDLSDAWEEWMEDLWYQKRPLGTEKPVGSERVVRSGQERTPDEPKSRHHQRGFRVVLVEGN